MKRFTIRIGREVTQQASVVVEAEDLKSAIRAAFDSATKLPQNWELAGIPNEMNYWQPANENPLKVEDI